jgi:hypothetical protein
MGGGVVLNIGDIANGIDHDASAIGVQEAGCSATTI